MKTIPLTVRIDATVKKNLDARARLKKISTADLVREILNSEDTGKIINQQIRDTEKLKQNIADIDEHRKKILSGLDKTASEYSQQLAGDIQKISEGLDKLYRELKRRSQENINSLAEAEKTARKLTGVLEREGWTEVGRWAVQGLLTGLLVGVAVFLSGLFVSGKIADRSAAAVRAELHQATETVTNQTAPQKRTGRQR